MSRSLDCLLPFILANIKHNTACVCASGKKDCKKKKHGKQPKTRFSGFSIEAGQILLDLKEQLGLTGCSGKIDLSNRQNLFTLLIENAKEYIIL